MAEDDVDREPLFGSPEEVEEFLRPEPLIETGHQQMPGIPLERRAEPTPSDLELRAEELADEITRVPPSKPLLRQKLTRELTATTIAAERQRDLARAESLEAELAKMQEKHEVAEKQEVELDIQKNRARSHLGMTLNQAMAQQPTRQGFLRDRELEAKLAFSRQQVQELRGRTSVEAVLEEMPEGFGK